MCTYVVKAVLWIRIQIDSVPVFSNYVDPDPLS